MKGLLRFCAAPVILSVVAAVWLSPFQEFFEVFGMPGSAVFEGTSALFLSALISALVYFYRKYTETSRLLSHHKDAQESANELAHRDTLTGLSNRRRFEQVFSDLTETADTDLYRGVFMLDLDGFKPINDVYGHAFGDGLLRIFADRLIEVIGDKGLVARLGGDEFAIVTPSLETKEEAAAIASRIIKKVDERFCLDGRQVSIGTGIGISIFPDDGYSSAELLRRADIALYRAKNAGRSSFRFFEVEMDAAILHRTLLEQRLRAALSNKEILPKFQPIFDLTTNKVVAFESLARWTDQDFGNVPPSQFIPIAEESSMISDLSSFLLEESCKAAVTWPPHIGLNFNLSAVQLRDPHLPERIVSILRVTGMTAQRLTLEITETSLVKDPDKAKTVLEELAQAGITIALDDFGTGHSSLRYLREFPINKVKIDRTFTSTMGHDQESNAIIQAILGLSKGLDIEVVAEGIESADLVSTLAANGCQYGQGFYFGDAAPADQVGQLVGFDVADLAQQEAG